MPIEIAGRGVSSRDISGNLRSDRVIDDKFTKEAIEESRRR